MHTDTPLGAIGLTLLAIAAGCATTTPPPTELVTARHAYYRASSGQAASLTPAQVHEAKIALDAAEKGYVEQPQSRATRDLAYIAERRAELAESRGSIASAFRDRAASLEEMNRARAIAASQTNGELARTRAQLNATGAQLNATGQELEAERNARALAEKRARDAMDKLAVAAALAVKEEPRGTVITIPSSVLFAFDKSELLPTARDKLDQVAEALKNQADKDMEVEGHTDSLGSDAYNLDLSKRRAQSVRDYLVSRGVPDDRIKSQGLGESRPIADNKSNEGRANNRRVEIIVRTREFK